MSAQSKYSKFNGFSRIRLVATAAIIIILGISALLFLNKQKKADLTNPKNEALSGEPKNLLINKSDVDRIKDSFNNSLKEEGIPTPTLIQTKFDYTIDKSLESGRLFTPASKALAAASCDIQSAPANVPIFVLKNHLSQQDAVSIASQFGLSGVPTSLPDDAGTFRYFFSDATSGILTILESSGSYVFHKLISSIGTQLNESAIRNIARDTLAAHGFGSGLIPVEEYIGVSNNAFAFRYRKQWGDFPVVDRGSILALQTSYPVCNIEASDVTNNIEIYIKNDGQLARLINQTKTPISSKSVPRLSLGDAVAEYKNSLPIDPIVIGGTYAGEVNIGEAALVWFDYGELFPQTVYVPMYLTSGFVGSTRVLTLFPAVSSSLINQEKFTNLDANSLKLQAFDPSINSGPISIPSQHPNITIAPDGRPPKILPTIPLTQRTECPAGFVDYAIRCAQTGATLCAGFITLPDRLDPFGICSKGCKASSGTINTQAGEDPCRTYLETIGMPINLYFPVTSKTLPGGPASCYFGGCPC